jgi:asparagine synthase (glutamine-hydrolysing)
MCGISGIVDFNKKLGKEKIFNILKNFNIILHHRGPDDSGIWTEDNIGIAHTRLSILDLSKNGHQPMVSKNKNIILSYNGEIYNFEDLKLELTDKNLKSKSDSEVLLEYYCEHGIDKLIEKANGMYAFSIYDKRKNQLILARDKVGKKPLYYFFDNEFCIWGSEINIFKNSPVHNKLKINSNAIDNFFKVGYVPNPISIFEQIQKLKPGEIIIIDVKSQKKISKRNFFIKKENQLVNNSVEETIRDSIRIRTISDVPYGVFLSSGIDSALVASILKDLKKNVDSFSIGIKNNQTIDESTGSKKIAKFLGLNHNELRIDEDSLINYFPKLAEVYGEPFADTSQIPTLILSEFSKKKISVALSGDGGDELFCGYNRYLYTLRYKKILQNIFKINKNINFIKYIRKFLNLLKIETECKLFSKLNTLENTTSFDDLYSKLVRLDNKEIDIFNFKNNDYKNFYLKSDDAFKGDELFEMQNKDIQNYLPDDILTKVDRASMKNSLEVRCPLLDHRLSSVIFFNKDLKIKNNQTKIILRNILKKYLDINFISKEKKGFAIPINKWLRSGLSNIVDDYFNSTLLKHDEFLSQKKINILWEKYKKGSSQSTNTIWSTLIYLQWKKHWGR